MAKKQKSFADKARGKDKVNYTHVKYVKSSLSEKTGHWRFNEQMVRLEKGENLDAALKRMEDEAHLVDLVSTETPEEISEKTKNGQDEISEEIDQDSGDDGKTDQASAEDNDSDELPEQAADDEQVEGVESTEEEKQDAEPESESDQPADGESEKEAEPA